MARKRMIDPEFWSDEEIGTKWGYIARLFYIGLWNFADDEGRIKAHPGLLEGQIFPYNKPINIPKLKKEVGSKVLWYEVDGSQYGWIRNFLKHQRIDRPTPSKLPAPPLGEGSASPQRAVPAKLREEKLREEKIRHRDFVLLTKEEYKKLCDLFGKDQADGMIEKLNNYIGSKGKQYKSHYFTILNWAGKDGIRRQVPVKSIDPRKDFVDPSPKEQAEVSKLVSSLGQKLNANRRKEKSK